MIKKIICPTDFSEAANNALEYAGKLAQVLGAEVHLVNVERIQPLLDGSLNMAEGIGTSATKKANVASQKLEQVVDEVKTTFNVPASYEVDITPGAMATAISKLGTDNSMIVMGTNGADGLRQFLFGTNTYNVISKAQCPVILVPENYQFKPYSNITFILIDTLNDAGVLSSFFEFAKIFNAKVTFVFVGRRERFEEQDFFQGIPETARKHYLEDENLEFKSIFSDDTDLAVDDFIRENPADLLVMVSHQRNAMERIFTKTPYLARFSASAYYPLLVFHY